MARTPTFFAMHSAACASCFCCCFCMPGAPWFPSACICFWFSQWECPSGSHKPDSCPMCFFPQTPVAWLRHGHTWCARRQAQACRRGVARWAGAGEERPLAQEANNPAAARATEVRPGIQAACRPTACSHAACSTGRGPQVKRAAKERVNEFRRKVNRRGQQINTSSRAGSVQRGSAHGSCSCSCSRDLRLIPQS